MLIQLQQLIKPIIGENNVDSVSDRLIQFVKELESDIKTNNDKGALFAIILRKVLNLTFDLYQALPSLSENEIEEVASKVFLFVYNNVFVPIDLPIPDYLEVIVERTLEPILDYIIRTVTKVAVIKLKGVLGK